MQNRIQSTYTQAQQDAVMEAIRTVRDNLPVLTSASPEDWQELNKMGPKSRTFVEACVTSATLFGEHLPARFDVATLEEELALYTDMEATFLALQDLFEKVRDTRMIAGSDALEVALEVYHYVKSAAGSEELNETYRTLRERFLKSRRKTTTPEDGGGTPA